MPGCAGTADTGDCAAQLSASLDRWSADTETGQARLKEMREASDGARTEVTSGVEQARERAPGVLAKAMARLR